MTSSTTTNVLSDARRVLASIPSERPLLVAFDGPSGAGKSTLADAFVDVADEPVARVTLDDFFTTRIAERDLHQMPLREKLDRMFEWDRARDEALTPLLGRAAKWRAFDYLAGKKPDGRWALSDAVTRVEPAPLILLDGWGGTAGPLDELIDFAVLVTSGPGVRRARQIERGDNLYGDVDRWHDDNDDIERWYFDKVRPADAFDLVIRT